jgi:dethiobiotin synthetase
MPTKFFVTGTDTNVGKTVLSALLVSALDGVYWKPVQSGACEGTDRCSVAEWAELKEGRALSECYCFDPPVSPHLAARMSGVEIDLGRIHLPDSVDSSPIIAEGAGGILTPLNDRQTILDLVRQLNFPVIVASRTSLGTINHTLLTLLALREAKVPLLGVVMIGEENYENRRAIEWYGKIRVIGHVPWLPVICRESLLRVFDSSFDKNYF